MSDTSGGEIIARMLKAEGVEVFGCGISRGIPVVRDIA